jgi:hypothetical protein
MTPVSIPLALVVKLPVDVVSPLPPNGAVNVVSKLLLPKSKATDFRLADVQVYETRLAPPLSNVTVILVAMLALTPETVELETVSLYIKLNGVACAETAANASASTLAAREKISLGIINESPFNYKS